jgi:hypothetical protein
MISSHGTLSETDKTVNHLFFQCKFAHSIWSIIHVASNLYPSSSAASTFGNSSRGIDHKCIILIRVGAVALIWSLWLCRNEMVSACKSPFPLHYEEGVL